MSAVKTRFLFETNQKLFVTFTSLLRIAGDVLKRGVKMTLLQNGHFLAISESVTFGVFLDLSSLFTLKKKMHFFKKCSRTF